MLVQQMTAADLHAGRLLLLLLLLSSCLGSHGLLQPIGAAWVARALPHHSSITCTHRTASAHARVSLAVAQSPQQCMHAGWPA